MSVKNLKILIVDNEHDELVKLIEPFSGILDIDFEINSFKTLTEILHSKDRSNYDIVLLNLFLPDSKGTETLINFQNCIKEVPIIAIGPSMDKEIASFAINNGAHDYLVKGAVDAPILIRTISHALERHKIFDKLHSLEKRLQAVTDSIKNIIFVIDLEGNYLFKSSSYTKLLGRDNSNNLFEDIHPDDTEKVKETLYELIQEGNDMEIKLLYRLIKEDNDTCSIESYASTIYNQGKEVKEIIMITKSSTINKQETKDTLYRS